MDKDAVDQKLPAGAGEPIYKPGTPLPPDMAARSDAQTRGAQQAARSVDAQMKAAEAAREKTGGK